MDIIKFFYNNLWRNYVLAETSEHPNFPAENTQHRDFNKAWRSNHGAGSGWGNFIITANSNDRLDFEDNGATVRVAPLTPSTYTADTLAAHIKTQMEAQTADTFTVEYLESSHKFKITDDAGVFELLWNSGANIGRSIANTIGFDELADDIGSDTYTADHPRIHTAEYIQIDLGSAQAIYGVMIRGHNLTATGSEARIVFSTDNFATWAETQAMTIQDNLLIYEWDAAKTYRYIRIRILNVENPDGYVKMGTIFVGGQFQPETNFMGDGSIDRQDPSNVLPSEDGQEASIQLSHFDLWSYAFHVKGLTERGYFDTFFDAVGKSKAFFCCEDPDLPLSTTKYVALNSFKWSGRRDVGLWTLSIQLREQR